MKRLFFREMEEQGHAGGPAREEVVSLRGGVGGERRMSLELRLGPDDESL